MGKPRPWRLYYGIFAGERSIIGTFSTHEAALRRARELSELRASGLYQRGFRISGPAPLPGPNDVDGWNQVRTYGLGRKWYEII